MDAVAEQAQIPAVPAYLDLAQPDLSEASRKLAEAGHTSAVVVPLLFTEAYHATIDVPERVQDVARSRPLELVVAGILGTGDEVAQLLCQSMDDAGIDDQSSVLLYAVGSSKPEANQAVLNLADRLAAGRRSPVRARFGTSAPGVTDVVDGLGEPVAIVPLFLSDGLLLSPVRAMAAQNGWRMAEPLGERAADLVQLRYDQACAR